MSQSISRWFCMILSGLRGYLILCEFGVPLLQLTQLQVMSFTAELPQRPRMEISKDLFLEFSKRILRSQVKDTFQFSPNIFFDSNKSLCFRNVIANALL